mmetsp:Transcript_84191/g.238531  ORF Transcript_84191/g.238531 Transcript_84191/m.238531 type:complete len:226 (+) Transcript_84191:1527-2204(+)
MHQSLGLALPAHAHLQQAVAVPAGHVPVERTRVPRRPDSNPPRALRAHKSLLSIEGSTDTAEKFQALGHARAILASTRLSPQKDIAIVSRRPLDPATARHGNFPGTRLLHLGHSGPPEAAGRHPTILLQHLGEDVNGAATKKGWRLAHSHKTQRCQSPGGEGCEANRALLRQLCPHPATACGLQQTLQFSGLDCCGWQQPQQRLKQLDELFGELRPEAHMHERPP